MNSQIKQAKITHINYGLPYIFFYLAANKEKKNKRERERENKYDEQYFQ